jgi:ABC-type multidrug transport system permease subunit
LQGLAVLQQYGGQAAGAAASALASLVSPFQLFEGGWLLNVLFFAVLGLLAYSLVVLAPRQ